METWWDSASLSTAACVLATALLLLLLLSGLNRRKIFSLDDLVVVITGAGSGIGKRLAETISSRAKGVTLVLLDIDMSALEAVRTALQSKCRDVFVHQCDVSDDVTVDACIKKVLQEITPRRIDVLVNNAGIVAGRSLLELTPAQIRATFAVNTLAHFWTVRAVLPSMKQDTKRDAMIVSISSILSLVPSAGVADYCASKAAVNAFHESMLLELKHDNISHIRTLLVCPTSVNTGMFEGVLQGDSWSLKLARQLVPLIEEEEAVESIYAAIVGGKKVLIYCLAGWRAWVFPWIPALTRLLPVDVYNYLVCVSGGRDGMNAFVGRKKKE